MSSLSKTIIYSSREELAARLRGQVQLDYIDEYGYTPLVQAAIVNQVDKAKLVLDAGAQVDFRDLTGRTALFWAADNGNLELCELLLKHRADPNAYASSGQPVLVMPWLKEQLETKHQLIAAGASLNFAQDFLNAKVLGHAFELEGRVDIVDTRRHFIEVELEGFYLRFTLSIIANSLADFEKNFAAQHLKNYFPYLDRVVKALQGGVSLAAYQGYLVDLQESSAIIDQLLESEILLLPISFAGHAITLIKIGALLIRCDRGSYGLQHGTVIYYEIRNRARFTRALCRQLLYKRQYPEQLNQALVHDLQLRPIYRLKLSPQITGNCSWANVEAVIPALLFSLLSQGVYHGTVAEESAQVALQLYQSWRAWNKSRALDHCIQSMVGASRARQVTKAALLGAILFQGCSNQFESDRVRANKILDVLLQPEYQYVLNSYVQVFSQAGNDNLLWKNFRSFLELRGLNVASIIRAGRQR